MTNLPPILIVDDQPENRKELTQSLSCVGFPVESASDALQAMDKFRSTKYSMVISNEQTPGIEGKDILGSVKKNITTDSGDYHICQRNCAQCR